MTQMAETANCRFQALFGTGAECSASGTPRPKIDPSAGRHLPRWQRSGDHIGHSGCVSNLMPVLDTIFPTTRIARPNSSDNSVAPAARDDWQRVWSAPWP